MGKKIIAVVIAIGLAYAAITTGIHATKVKSKVVMVLAFMAAAAAAVAAVFAAMSLIPSKPADTDPMPPKQGGMNTNQLQ